MANLIVAVVCRLLTLYITLLVLYPVAKAAALPKFMGFFDRKGRLHTSLVGAIIVNTSATILLGWVQLEIARLVHSASPGWIDLEISGWVVSAVILVVPYSNGSLKPDTAKIEVELDKMKFMRGARHKVTHNRRHIISYMNSNDVPPELQNELFDILTKAKQMNEWGGVFSDHFHWAMYLPCMAALIIMAYDPSTTTLFTISVITTVSTAIAAGVTANRFSVGDKIWNAATALVIEKAALDGISVTAM